MIDNKRKTKIIFLYKMMKKKKVDINKSIIQNKEIEIKNITYFNLLKEKNIKERKNCLFGISNKYIERKSKFSRFAIKKIIENSLNQNFRIFE